jgi:hypothetical protein
MRRDACFFAPARGVSDWRAKWRESEEIEAFGRIFWQTVLGAVLNLAKEVRCDGADGAECDGVLKARLHR